MKPRTCPECNDQLQQQGLTSVAGESMGWRVQALEYPVLACPRGHVLRELHPDFNTSIQHEFEYSCMTRYLRKNQYQLHNLLRGYHWIDGIRKYQ